MKRSRTSVGSTKFSVPIILSTVLVASVLGFGAVQELIVRGIGGGEVQPFWIGVIGAVLCILLIASAFALTRGWRGARSLAIAVSIAFICFHIYGSLPPHRNVGPLAALIASVYGLWFLSLIRRQPARRAV